jgi:hypothetical protein
MKLKISQQAKILIIIGLSILIGMSLSALCLLNISWFYEQTTTVQLKSLSILMIGFSLIAFFTTKRLILPIFAELSLLKNLLFIIWLIAFLALVLSIGAVYYWSVPEVQSVKMCFEAKEAQASVSIQELNEANTNRLFAPGNFGVDRYPIRIVSGSCAQGTIVNLVSQFSRWWIVPKIALTLEDMPQDGRLEIYLNDVRSVVDFSPETSKKIIVDEGLMNGIEKRLPWGQSWFLGVKFLVILISAVFISTFLFGLTEKMITFSSKENSTEGSGSG